jgi:hypothetical protein
MRETPRRGRSLALLVISDLCHAHTSALDLKKVFRYKKASTLWKKPYIMGFSGGFEQGKPGTALPELKIFISINTEGVNP